MGAAAMLRPRQALLLNANLELSGEWTRTCSSPSSAFDSCSMGLRGMTRKWTLACLHMRPAGAAFISAPQALPLLARRRIES